MKQSINLSKKPADKQHVVKDGDCNINELNQTALIVYQLIPYTRTTNTLSTT